MAERITKLWLDEKFSSIEEKLDTQSSEVKSHLAQDRIDFDNVVRLISALEKTKEEIHTALTIRIDRLEQARIAAESQKTWLKSFGPSILGAMTGAIFGWFGVGK